MERSLLEDQSKSSLLDPEDAILKNLQQKGFAHEPEFLSSLISNGKTVIEIKYENTNLMLEKTKEAMTNGLDVIAQGYLEKDNFGGVSDFLIK